MFKPSLSADHQVSRYERLALPEKDLADASSGRDFTGFAANPTIDESGMSRPGDTSSFSARFSRASHNSLAIASALESFISCMPAIPRQRSTFGSFGCIAATFANSSAAHSALPCAESNSATPARNSINTSTSRAA